MSVPLAAPMTTDDEQVCRKCGEMYPLIFFRVDKRIGEMIRYRSVCKGCEQTARDTKKSADRFRVKAQETIRLHARKYIRAGALQTTDEFRQRFGWEDRRLADDLKRSYGGECGYCGNSYAVMRNGLGEITV